MRILLSVLSLITFLFSVIAEASSQSPKVGVLISSYGEEGRENLSYDLEELAQAYLVLYDNGVSIDILSPKGGAVLVKNNKDDLPYIQRFKKETPALTQLKATIPSKDANADNYDAILVVGGSGAMFDLPTDPATQQLLGKFVRQNKPIAAVCHGPAALVNLKLSDGSYYVANKKVNGFTNLEEQTFGSDVINELPFMLEDKLKQRGAIFVSNAPMLPYISVDNNLITAQNPGAVAKATEALLTKIDVNPKARTLYKDEASLLLISQAKDTGTYLIDIALKAEPQLYDLNYLALYGFYAYNLAQSQESKLKELEIMQSIARFFEHPIYLSQLIKAEIEQGYIQQAKHNFGKFKEQYPNHELLPELRTMTSIN